MSLIRLLPRPARSQEPVAAAPPRLVLADPVVPTGACTARVVGVHRETHDATSLTLDPDAGWKGFRAGQQVRLQVEADGVPRTGRFWISSSDSADTFWGDRTVSVVVHRHDEDPVSRHLARQAGIGTAVELSAPEGSFVLPTPSPRSLLLVSGGTGITPLMSMLRSLVDSGHDGRVVFVHYARTPEETCFAEELDEIAQRHREVELSVLHTRVGDQRLHELQLHALAPHFAQLTTYACGPEGMLATLRRLYEGRDTLYLPVEVGTTAS